MNRVGEGASARFAASAGWLVVAAFFATLLGSIVHVDYVGLVPELTLALIALTCFVRPRIGIPLLALAIPLAWYTAAGFWNSRVEWAEVVTCAGVCGLSLEAARHRETRLPPALSAAVMLFCTLLVTAMVSALALMRERLGPGFTEAIVTHLTREHFVDLRGFPALRAGLLLLEGVLLFALSARRAAMTDTLFVSVQRATVAAASIAAALNVWHLLTVAVKRDHFWSALWQLASAYRWNVHYADFNAAGSYFAMALLVAAALWWCERYRRLLWGVCAIAIAIAILLTGSRAAILAALMACVASFLAVRLVSRTGGARHPFTGAAAAAAGAVLLLVGVATVLPQRGNQHSAMKAADVRLGLARTSIRMIQTHPLFGIGLGEFYQRSGEPTFTDPELLREFPVAIHENAHNNFLQVATELGLPGGALFVWLVAAALAAIALKTVRTGDVRWALPAAALGAFVITWLAGHPLLVPEAAFAFWLLLGAATGAAVSGEPATPPRLPARAVTALLCLLIVGSLPWRMDALSSEADFEHVCVGCSPWQTSPDGIRSREAEGHATLFVPGDAAFKVSMNPQANRPVRLELRLDGRIANIVLLPPGRWTDVSVPARTERNARRYARLDVRVLDDDKTRLWMTKVEPIG